MSLAKTSVLVCHNKFWAIQHPDSRSVVKSPITTIFVIELGAERKMSALDAIAKKLLKTQELKALQHQKLGIDSVLDSEIKSEAGNTQTSPARTAVTEISGNICTGGGGVPSTDPLKV